MNTIKIIGILLTFGILQSTYSQSMETKDVDRTHPVNFVKDSAITAAIKSKLAAEHFASLTQISVDTDSDGKVWLSGYTSSQVQIDRAVAIANATDGVKSVRSNLAIRTSSK